MLPQQTKEFASGAMCPLKANRVKITFMHWFRKKRFVGKTALTNFE